MILIAGVTSGQRLAILAPEATTRDIAYADELASQFQSPTKVLDRDQVTAAFRSITIANPFNMTTSEARAVASVVGCDTLLIVRSSSLRRTPLTGSDFIERFAVHYLVDGRTGEMMAWRLQTFQGVTEAKAAAALVASITATAALFSERIRRAPSASTGGSEIESVPEDGSARSVNLKPPIPYKRIRPEYTQTAYLYDIKATVDIEADIAPDGSVLGTKIVRWAGFGLDESVDSAVRAMNWRPAMRAGRPLPMRVLLRYNFTKVEKE